jgi:hypothetical protein
MLFFHKIKIHFDSINPLANGLDQDIAAERAEPDAITLEENLDPYELEQTWQDIEEEFESDVEWKKLQDHS